MEELAPKYVYVLGDTHTLRFLDLLKKADLRDFLLIHVGDAGEGFNPKFNQASDNHDLELLAGFAKKNNGKILIVRGNHSNPEYYQKGHWTAKFRPYVEFVEDNTYKKIKGKIFFFSGGAVSIDRKYRTVGKDYWLGEGFILPNLEDLEECDVMITHSSPYYVYPHGGLEHLNMFFAVDAPLKNELIDERLELQKLYEKLNPKIALFYGHFHASNTEYKYEQLCRCLAIDELYDLTNLL